MSRVQVLLTVMVAAAALVLAVVAMLLGVPWWLALAIAVVTTVVIIKAVSAKAPSMVLDAVGAAPLGDSVAHERLAHVVESLCLSTGVNVPALWVLDQPGLNAMVVGRSQAEASLVVTSGLLEQLNRTQLEGVAAHLLARLRSDQLPDATLAAVVVGKWLGFSRALQQRAYAWILDDHVFVLADREAASITRYPPGLAAALVTMNQGHRSLGSASRSTRHLWMEDPVRTDDDAIDVALQHRIEALQEL